MKVLFVMCKENTDHLASCLWDGLQDVLGEENVVDAVGHRLLHSSMCGESVYKGEADGSRFGSLDVLGGIGGRREGRVLQQGESGFDLLVLNAAFLREWDWQWAKQWLALLKPRAKVAYVEGWDSSQEVHCPEIHVDHVFRKEIDPSYHYPYACAHLTFAAPYRWFHDADKDCQRPWDVFYSGTTHSNELRWAALAGVYQSNARHRSIICSSHLGVSVPDYFSYYQRSKLALCPASAERADSLRTYEAIACGAIPLFVGYPPWKRENWLDGFVFQCATSWEVASHIDAALARDLPAMRAALLTHARTHHTTRARALQILSRTGGE